MPGAYGTAEWSVEVVEVFGDDVAWTIVIVCW